MRKVRKLARIDLMCSSIEPFWVLRFELGGIEPPLIGGNIEPSQNRREPFCNVPALVTADHASGPVDECQVRLEVE